MYKLMLVSIMAAMLVLSAGCISQGTGTANTSNGTAATPIIPNNSGNVTPLPNATTNDTTEPNSTAALNQTPIAFKCAEIASPSAEQEAACKKKVSAYVAIKNESNCTTEYRCMTALERVTYDLSKIQIQDERCPEAITADVLYQAANICGADYESLEVIVTSRYNYVGQSCVKSLSINCTTYSAFVRATS
jgi:hypothetical protein